MKCFWCAVFTGIVTIVVLKVINKIRKLLKTPSVPHLEETWWGPRNQTEENESIESFSINISNKIITDLNEKLRNARPFTSPLEGTQHQYGINTKLLNEIVEFWKTEYKWKEREVFLNKYPQFTVSIQGLKIHYIHVKPSNIDGHRVLPLLLLHGWPGSVREFYDIIPLLTTPQRGRSFVFEVLAPSLPGYGFSEAAVRPGLGDAQMAVLFKNFMKRLEFDKYYVQGGDWGAIITQHMAALYPQHVLGLHSNMCGASSLMSNVKLYLFSFWPTLIVDKKHIDKVYPMSAKFANTLLESGYMHLQATKPDTVGVALNDSPVGLAAYILEKFITWTNPKWKDIEDGGLNKAFSYTALLDNVMIYWVTNSITTSMRLYSETINKKQMALGINGLPVTVPTAVARFSNDLVYSPTFLLKERYKNIVYVSDHDGGHFAAFEVPKVLADDIFKGVDRMERYHKENNAQ